MYTRPVPAKRMFKTGIIMCLLWLGAATMIVWAAQGGENAGNRPAPTIGKLFSFLEIHSDAHLDNLPVQ